MKSIRGDAVIYPLVRQGLFTYQMVGWDTVRYHATVKSHVGSIPYGTENSLRGSSGKNLIPVISNLTFA